MKRIACLILAVACVLSVSYGFIGCKKETKVSSRYEITAEYLPESGTLAGTTKLTFENCGDNEISVLKFQLYPNAYRKDALFKPVSKAYENAAYYAGESYGEMVISSVNGAKNWEVMGEDENILYVYLERSLFPDDKVVLDIGFLLKLARVNHRTGVTEKTVNLGNFFPVLCAEKDGGFYECAYYSDGDPFLSECADFKVTITAPKDYLIAATGETVSERSLESKKEHIFTAQSVRDFAMVLSDHFEVMEKTVGDTELVYYYYDDPSAKETLATAAEAFAYFEDTFGDYPYARYSVAQTGFCLAGMEYPNLAMISDDLLAAELSRAIVHETAHQWWYGVVGSNQIEEAWQDEGLAEYSALLFFENYEKYGFNREDTVMKALKEYRSYYDVYGSVLGRTDTRMTRHLKDYLSDYEYKCLAYDKPLVMLDTLRKSVGDEQFLSSLKKYYATNKFAVASSADLIAAFEKTGLDVHGFFDSFLSGKAIL
ncbi:MAG: M1 family metallopeptidase [Clostridia bacterium]|nr:M1 family metallopeptidase [Clostridia bacterium]